MYFMHLCEIERFNIKHPKTPHKIFVEILQAPFLRICKNKSSRKSLQSGDEFFKTRCSFIDRKSQFF